MRKAFYFQALPNFQVVGFHLIEIQLNGAKNIILILEFVAFLFVHRAYLCNILKCKQMFLYDHQFSELMSNGFYVESLWYKVIHNIIYTHTLVMIISANNHNLQNTQNMLKTNLLSNLVSQLFIFCEPERFINSAANFFVILRLGALVDTNIF